MAASNHPVGLDHPTVVPANFETPEEGDGDAETGES